MEDDTYATTYAKNKILLAIHHYTPKFSVKSKTFSSTITIHDVTRKTYCTTFHTHFILPRIKHARLTNNDTRRENHLNFPNELVMAIHARPHASAISVHFNNDIGLGKKFHRGGELERAKANPFLPSTLPRTKQNQV